MIWFLALFVMSLFIGMTPMEISAGLLSLAAVYGIWNRRMEGRNWPILLTGFDWIFGVWIFASWASFAVNGIWDNSVGIEISEFKWLPFLYLLSFAIQRSRLSEKAIPWITGFAVLASIYAIVISFLGFDPIKDRMIEAFGDSSFVRSGGLFSDPYALALCYGVILNWFLGALIVLGRFRDRLSLWIGLGSVFLLVAIGLTFVHEVWFCLILSFACMAFVYSRRWGFSLGLFGVLGFGLVSQFSSGFRAWFSGSVWLISESDWSWTWKAHWSLFKMHPFLGTGMGENFRQLPEVLRSLGAPAQIVAKPLGNQYLDLLSGHGILGLILYCTVLVLFLSLSFRTWGEIPHKHVFKKGLCLGLIGAQAMNIFVGFFGENFEQAKYKFVLVLTWALAVWLAYEYRVLRERI